MPIRYFSNAGCCQAFAPPLFSQHHAIHLCFTQIWEKTDAKNHCKINAMLLFNQCVTLYAHSISNSLGHCCCEPLKLCNTYTYIWLRWVANDKWRSMTSRWITFTCHMFLLASFCMIPGIWEKKESTFIKFTDTAESKWIDYAMYFVTPSLLHTFFFSFFCFPDFKIILYLDVDGFSFAVTADVPEHIRSHSHIKSFVCPIVYFLPHSASTVYFQLILFISPFSSSLSPPLENYKPHIHRHIDTSMCIKCTMSCCPWI